MPAKYKLTYLNVPGRAEQIRFIFAAAQVPFDDVRISMAEFQQNKESKRCWAMSPVSLSAL